MFYSDLILAKKGPLANIWLAAHLSNKLSKSQVFDTNIEGSVQSIVQPAFPLALRVSGHLLLGVVRIYSRQVKYLFADCNFARSSLSKEYNNTNVDLPAEAVSGSTSINLAGGFGNFYDEDEELLYSAPNVRRWADLAIYQRVDGGNDEDDEEEDLELARSQHHSNIMQGHDPESFTSFGGSGFGQGMSGFDSDEGEVELGRANAEQSRQSLGFDTSPVAAGDASNVFEDENEMNAPVDDSINFGGGEQPDTYGDEFYAAPEDGNSHVEPMPNEEGDGKTANEDTEQNQETRNPKSVPAPVKRRRARVRFDDGTTVPRKSLRLKENTRAAGSAVRVQDRDLQVWFPIHQHPAMVAPLTGARLDAVFLEPASGITSPAFLRMFAASVNGTLRIRGLGPAKRSRDSISGGNAVEDEDALEIARRRSDASVSLGGASAFGGDESMMSWGGDEERPFEPEDGNSMYAAPLDGDISMTDANASLTSRPRNEALMEALKRHQMGSTAQKDDATTSLEADADGLTSSQQDGGEEKLHPRTLVVMREINHELGVDASEDTQKAAPKKSLRFDDMISGFSKAPAAAAFFEILALKTRGFIDVKQGVSFSEIAISSTGTFVDPGTA
eukprot:INCI3747.1.p1 GENE.INCI3747.1~~INCI3747.1.p1  ORF type:complete len:616 (-),score=134.58 INCI3747.1:83-1930(-)